MLGEQQHDKGVEHRQVHFGRHQLRVEEIAFYKMQYCNHRQHIDRHFQPADAIADNAERNQGDDKAYNRDQTEHEDHDRQREEVREAKNPQPDDREESIEQCYQNLGLNDFAEGGDEFLPKYSSST